MDMLKSKIQKALECSEVITMPFKTGDSAQESRLMQCAAELLCSAKLIKVSRFYSCVLIEKQEQLEMI